MPPKGKTSWSVRDLAQASGLSATTVHRILHEGRLKPHKAEYWCGRSPDPEFEAKQAAILGLYLDPIYLASHASGYVTGQNIIVDGGLSAW